MEYNSSKENLEMPEYGRNVQLLVDYIKTIEDEEYRQAFAERVIDLMHQMNPQNRTVEDYRGKLWKHLFQISKFDLAVTTPDGVIPTEEEFMAKPEKVPYPKSETRFRHYGTNVQKMIKEAMAMEPGPKKEGFTAVIGSYMKLAYRTWNREHYVSDEVIKNDLSTLSDGELVIRDSIYLDPIASQPNNSRGGHNDKDNRRRTTKRSTGTNRSGGKYSRNNNKTNRRK